MLCVLAAAGYLGAKWFAARNVARQIDITVTRIPEIKAVEYNGLDVALFRQNISLRDVTVTLAETGQEFHIDRLAVDGFEQGGTIPGKLHVLIDGLDLDLTAPLMAPVRNDLERLGYHRLEVSLECRYGYDETAKKLDVQQFSVAVAQMGKIEITVGIQNLDISRLKGSLENPLSLALLLPTASVSTAHLQYRDASLVKRILENGARRSGQSVPEYTRRIFADLSRTLGEAQDARIRDSLAAVDRFLKRPGQLSIRLSPEKPVPFLRLMFVREPAALAALFRLQVDS